MSNKKLRYFFNEIIAFLTNRRFLLNLLAIGGFLILVLIGIFTWLRIYTNHGQKLELPDYVDQDISTAIADAADKTFEIIVNDSVHIINKSGGLIIHQNPAAGSLVKEKRKLYVTITKHEADKVDLSDQMFFGQEYDQVEASLRTKSISSKIKDFQYDHLTQNSVLEVWYEGKKVISRQMNPETFIVDKGSTLEFIVSSSQGGSSEVLDLTNSEVGSARFRLTPYKLNLEIINEAEFQGADLNSAIIIEQEAPPGTMLPTDGVIRVKVKLEN